MNGTASQIADVYMEGISELSEIQKEVQMLHNYALAHIIATDQESLVNLVECARTTEALLESDLQNFQKCLLDEQRASFDKVQQDYYLLKDDVSRQEMEVISERMRQNQNIAKSLEAGTAMFEKF